MSEAKLPLRRGRLAILDLVSMFLGVFLAFAFDNYREDQEKLKREREYLVALACEVSDEVTELLRVDSIYTAKVDNMKQFFRATRASEREAPADSLHELFRSFMFRYPFPTGFNSVYESMQSSGDLSLLRDKAFVQQLVRHDQSRQDLKEQGHMLLSHLTVTFFGYIQPRYDYRQRVFYDQRQLRSRELLSYATTQQAATRDYTDILGIHLARTLELQQALAAYASSGCR